VHSITEASESIGLPPFFVGVIVLAILIADEVTQRGESTWYEGLQLLAIYAVLGLTFFLVGWKRTVRPDFRS